MTILSILLIVLLGYIMLTVSAPRLSFIERFGLSAPIGWTVITLEMFIGNIFGIPVTVLSVLLMLVIPIIGLSAWKFGLLKNSMPNWKSINESKFYFNITWLLLFGLAVYVSYGTISKALYWPVAAYDTVAGYDYTGKMIAHEGTFHVSLFKRNAGILLNRFIYPPLIPAASAITVLFGFETSKIITVTFFLSMLVSFYGLLRNFTNATAAMFFTFCLLMTPELLAHGSLALTNMPSVIGVAWGLAYLYLWAIHRQTDYFVVAIMLLAMANWLRSDSVAMGAVGGVLVLLVSIKKKEWKYPAIYAVCVLSTLFLWNFYMRFALDLDSSKMFEKKLFYDQSRLDIIFPYLKSFYIDGLQLYGATFWVFYVMVLLNIKYVFKTKIGWFVALMLGSIFLYTFLFYQMSYILDNLNSYMRAGYKRGLFPFLGMAWFFTAVNPVSVYLFKKLEDSLNIYSPLSLIKNSETIPVSDNSQITTPA